MIELRNRLISTYTKSLLSDWPVLSGMLREEATQLKNVIQSKMSESDASLTSQINEQQINDALNGPFQHFFKIHLHAYATIAKIESALNIRKEDFFKENEHTVNAIFGLTPAFLEKIELSTLKQLREKCDALTKQHHVEWKSNIQNWHASLLTEFKKNNLLLSDLELQDFYANETISELHNRFLDLKLTLPKLSKSAFDFNQYFTVKITLAIHSALARMQQPHNEKEIEVLLKHYQSTLKTINKAENGLVETQKKAISKLIPSIKDRAHS